MRRALITLTLVAFSFSGAAAHAGTITAGVYNLYDAYVAGYSVTGTVRLNSNGKMLDSNLTFNDPNVANPDVAVFNQPYIANFYNGLSQSYITTSNYGGLIALYFNTTADANGNLNLCIGNAQCGTSPWTIDPSTLQVYGFYNPLTGSNPGLATTNFSSGYLSQNSPIANPATSVVSEPMSVLLLGTGILGLAGAARLRRV